MSCTEVITLSGLCFITPKLLNRSKTIQCEIVHNDLSSRYFIGNYNFYSWISIFSDKTYLPTELNFIVYRNACTETLCMFLFSFAFFFCFDSLFFEIIFVFGHQLGNEARRESTECLQTRRSTASQNQRKNSRNFSTVIT